MNKSIFLRKVTALVLAMVFISLLWYLAAGIVDKKILPDPVAVYLYLPSLFQRQLALHIVYSLFRVFSGMIISLISGFLIGLIMGSSVRWDKILDPILYLTYPIPKLALLPIVMLLFGLGESSKIIMIVLIVMPQVVMATRDAIRDIPARQYEVLRAIGATRIQLFKYVTFPASLYNVISTLRISLGTTLSVLFFTENYGTEFGMGYFIMDSWLRMDYRAMYGGIIVLSLIGVALFFLIDFAESYGMRWRKRV